MLVIILLSVILDSSSVPTLLFAMCVTGWCPIAAWFAPRCCRLAARSMSSWQSDGRQTLDQRCHSLHSEHFKRHHRQHHLPHPGFIFSEAFLSYVGLGVQPPATSWGALCSAASLNFLFYPYQLVAPAGLIALTMLCFTLIGDGLRDALDPKLRR